LCHQTAGLIARAAELQGIPTLVLGSAFDILSSAWPPRTAFVNYPLGHQAGKPLDIADQLRVVQAGLAALELMQQPGQVSILDCNWGDTEDLCAIVGGREVVLRRSGDTRYQCQEDLDVALARHGQEAAGIVSAEALRQHEELKNR